MADHRPSWPAAIAIALLIAATLMLATCSAPDVPASVFFSGSTDPHQLRGVA